MENQTRRDELKALRDSLSEALKLVWVQALKANERLVNLLEEEIEGLKAENIRIQDEATEELSEVTGELAIANQAIESLVKEATKCHDIAK